MGSSSTEVVLNCVWTRPPIEISAALTRNVGSGEVGVCAARCCTGRVSAKSASVAVIGLRTADLIVPALRVCGAPTRIAHHTLACNGNEMITSLSHFCNESGQAETRQADQLCPSMRHCAESRAIHGARAAARRPPSRSVTSRRTASTNGYVGFSPILERPQWWLAGRPGMVRVPARPILAQVTITTASSSAVLRPEITVPAGI